MTYAEAQAAAVAARTAFEAGSIVLRAATPETRWDAIRYCQNLATKMRAAEGVVRNWDHSPQRLALAA